MTSFDRNISEVWLIVTPRPKFVIVLLALLLLVPLAITGAQSGSSVTYYIDGANGNDSNAGTNAAPWQTVQHAIDTINPGDTVIIRAGIYYVEELRFGPAGEGFDQRTVFQAASNERVLFTRSNGLPPRIQMDDFVRIDGFWFGGAWDRETNYHFQVGGSPIGMGKQVVNNTLFGYRGGINIGSSEYLLVQGNHFVHTGNGSFDHGIYVSGGGPVGSRTNHIIVDRNVFVAGEGYAIHGWHDPKTTIVTRNFVGRHNAGIVMGGGNAVEHLIANNIIWKTLPGSQLSGDHIYFVNNIHGPATPIWSWGQPYLTISNNAFLQPVDDPTHQQRTQGDNAIIVEQDQITAALGVSETEIDAAIDALDTAFSQSVQAIYADQSIEAHFEFLESLQAVSGGPLSGQGIKWFDGGGTFDLGVNVPAPANEEAFWQAFRSLGLKEYDQDDNVIPAS